MAARGQTADEAKSHGESHLAIFGESSVMKALRLREEAEAKADG